MVGRAVCRPRKGICTGKADSDVAGVPTGGIGGSCHRCTDGWGSFIDLDGNDIAGAAVARQVGDHLCCRSHGIALAAQHLVGGAACHPGQTIGAGKVDGDIILIPAVGIGLSGCRRVDSGGALVDLDCDHIAGRAAVTRLVRNRWCGRGDGCTFVAQHLVGGAASHPRQIIGAGKVNSDIAVIPTGNIGIACRCRADGWRGGIALDGHTFAAAAGGISGRAGEGDATGVAGDILRLTAALAADGGAVGNHRPGNGDIAHVPAVVAQRADNIGCNGRWVADYSEGDAVVGAGAGAVAIAIGINRAIGGDGGDHRAATIHPVNADGVAAGAAADGDGGVGQVSRAAQAHIHRRKIGDRFAKGGREEDWGCGCRVSLARGLVDGDAGRGHNHQRVPTASHANNPGQPGRHVGLAIGIIAPGRECAVTLKRHAMVETGGNGDHATQPGRYICLPVFIAPPGDDGAVALER